MTSTFVVYYLLCLNSFVLAKVVLQQTTPTPVHPGNDVIFTCTVTVSRMRNQSVVLVWVNPDDSQDRKLYFSNDTISANDAVVGAFNTKLVDVSNDVIISNATINEIKSVSIMSAGIKCLDSIGNEEILYICSDAPSAPLNFSSRAVSLTSVLLSWNPPLTSDTSCTLATYTITVSAASLSMDVVAVNTTDNTTNKTVSGLTRGIEYSITVTGVDARGRAGENSGLSNITLDTLPEVISLSSYSEQSSITVTWLPPTPSSRPPVTGYKISHNTTSIMMVTQTSHTVFTVGDLIPGVYLFSVLAINILGDGEEMSVTGLISTIITPSNTVTVLSKEGDGSTIIIIILGIVTGITTIILLITGIVLLSLRKYVSAQHSRKCDIIAIESTECKVTKCTNLPEICYLEPVLHIPESDAVSVTKNDYATPQLMTHQQNMELKKNVAYNAIGIQP